MLSFSSFKRLLVKLSSSPLGSFMTNCYLLDVGRRLLIVDPGSEADILIDHIKKKHSGKEVDIFLTHGHCDHIGAVPGICDNFPRCRIYGSKSDTPLYTDPIINLSSQTTGSVDLKRYMSKFVFVKDGDVLTFDEERFKVFDVPGHTPGSTALMLESQKWLFSGDTLFKGSVGNTELPLGNFENLMKSIMEKLYVLDDDVLVFSGHGEPTTIGAEKQSNPFILAEVERRKRK